MINKKKLDVTMIPVAGEEEENAERAKRARKDDAEAKDYIISGYDKNLNNNLALKTIYRELRRPPTDYHNYDKWIKVSQIHLEGNSRKTVENVVETIKIVEKIGAKIIGVASYPQHIGRIGYIIQKGKEEGVIEEDVEVIPLPTEQTFKEWEYGILANLKERYNLRRGIKKAQKNRTGKLGNLVKRLIS